VLAAFGVVLPIRVRHAADDSLIERCARLADTPPVHSHDTLAELERCRAVVPDDLELLADLGAAYALAGRRADAEQAYHQVLAVDPDHGDVRVRLATLMLERGAVGDARAQAREALRIQPNREPVLRLLQTIQQHATP